MSYAYCCEVCDGTDPHWYIMRRGDAVISWACNDHLATVSARLQRDSGITELTVRRANATIGGSPKRRTSRSWILKVIIQTRGPR